MSSNYTRLPRVVGIAQGEPYLDGPLVIRALDGTWRWTSRVTAIELWGSNRRVRTQNSIYLIDSRYMTTKVG